MDEVDRGDPGVRDPDSLPAFGVSSESDAHLLFGFLIVRSLGWLRQGFGRLADRLCACASAQLRRRPIPRDQPLRTSRCGDRVRTCPDGPVRKIDRVIASLQRHLAHESDALAFHMRFPDCSDLFLTDVMTLGGRVAQRNTSPTVSSNSPLTRPNSVGRALWLPPSGDAEWSQSG